MFSNEKEMDFEGIFEDYKIPDAESLQLDLVFENYVGLVNKLKQDLTFLKKELNNVKRSHGEITNSLDEFITIQRLSSIITQSLEYDQIVKNLDEIACKIMPHQHAATFLLEEGELIPVSAGFLPDFEVALENMQEEGILDWLWDHDHAIVIPISDFAFQEPISFVTGSLVMSPMSLNAKTIGIYIFHADNKEAANFHLRDLELLHILTNQAAIAIQYTRLYKRLEQAHDDLKTSQSRLMQTIKLATVGELAGGIAHEINNPLQIILGNIQMALMGIDSEKSLKVVEKQAMRIANIVRGLLNMARQGDNTPMEYVEINSVIMSALNLVRGQIEKRNIKIELELEDHLPIFQGNSTHLQQIFLNLFLNAKKQVQTDGALLIKSTSREKNWIQVEVEDTGAPMERSEIEKILNLFEGNSNVTDINFGLAVSIQMIQDIGGKIQIDMDRESGNRFIIQFLNFNQNENELKKDLASG